MLPLGTTLVSQAVSLDAVAASARLTPRARFTSQPATGGGSGPVMALWASRSTSCSGRP